MVGLTKMKIVTFSLLAGILLFSCDRPAKNVTLTEGDAVPVTVPASVQWDEPAIPYPRLSAYGFFQLPLKSLHPQEGVMPYELITPLFTDYAHKARFVWMPPGRSASFADDGRILFPDQSVLIKNFYYPADFRRPQENWDLIETRLLVKAQGQWQAYTYIWNDKDTDAILSTVGDFRTAQWIDDQGLTQQVDYVVPNKNQCKSCHNVANNIEPIGPKYRNLNRSVPAGDGRNVSQLARWVSAGYLTALPPEDVQWATLAHWQDDKAPLEDRALAYLEINCGHCHNPQGPAHTTGLFLLADEPERQRLGFCKAPVAAGKGSGGRQFGIVPGNPDASILVYRMENTDPGIMMPELGRMMPHREGIALIREWIAGLSGNCAQEIQNSGL